MAFNIGNIIHIPEGYELDSKNTEWTLLYDEDEDNYLFRVKLKKKEKSFSEYVKEYYKTITGLISSKSDSKYQPSTWDIAYKLGLLWYMIEDKGGDYFNFVELLEDIEEKVNNSYTDVEGVNIASRVLKILPDEFINKLVGDN